MKEWKVVLLGLLAVVVSGCSGSADTPFYGEGISFTCPAGWKIDETEYAEEGYYVCVEREEINNSGLLLILAFNEQIDQLEYLRSSQEEMKSQGAFRKLTFGELAPGFYGDYPGLRVDYEASVMGVPSQGRMIIFDVYGRTIFVSSLGAVDDEKKNQKDFKTLERTFKVEKIFSGPQVAADDFFLMEDDEAEEIQELPTGDIEE